MYVNRKFYQIQEDLISSFDVRFVLLAGSSMPFFVEGVVLQIAGWLNRPVGELSPAHRGAKISDISTVSRNLPFRFAKKGIEGVISRPLFHHSR